MMMMMMMMMTMTMMMIMMMMMFQIVTLHSVVNNDEMSTYKAG